MAADGYGYEKTRCMGEEYINEDIWTNGRTKSMERRTNQDLLELYKDLD